MNNLNEFDFLICHLLDKMISFKYKYCEILIFNIEI